MNAKTIIKPATAVYMAVGYKQLSLQFNETPAKTYKVLRKEEKGVLQSALITMGVWSLFTTLWPAVLYLHKIED